MIWKKKLRILIINKSLNYIQSNAILLFEVYENTEGKNQKFFKAKNGTVILLSKCAVCKK